jgi:hypothetical protein
MIARAAFSICLTLTLVLVTLQAQQSQTYGAGVSLKETTPLAQLIDKPADFEGKTVRVEGVVTAVCMHMGCWMALTPDASSADAGTMLIKVDDGVIVFPPSAKGKRAVAQGVIERIGGSREGQEAASEHAKSTGASKVTWQLKATGAMVY